MVQRFGLGRLARFRTCAEEDFDPAMVDEHCAVVMFFDCNGSATGTLFTTGGSFDNVVGLSNKGRLHLVLVNEPSTTGESTARQNAVTALGTDGSARVHGDANKVALPARTCWSR